MLKQVFRRCKRIPLVLSICRPWTLRKSSELFSKLNSNRLLANQCDTDVAPFQNKIVFEPVHRKQLYQDAERLISWYG